MGDAPYCGFLYFFPPLSIQARIVLAHFICPASGVRVTQTRGFWVHLLFERYPAQPSASPPAQFQLLPTGQNLTKKKSGVAPNNKNRPIIEQGTASEYISSDCARWAKTRTTSLEKRIFELGTSRRDCGLVPRSGVAVSLISRNRRSKMNSERKQSQNKTRSSLIRAGFDLEAVCYAGPVF